MKNSKALTTVISFIVIIAMAFSCACTQKCDNGDKPETVVSDSPEAFVSSDPDSTDPVSTDTVSEMPTADRSSEPADGTDDPTVVTEAPNTDDPSATGGPVVTEPSDTGAPATPAPTAAVPTSTPASGQTPAPEQTTAPTQTSSATQTPAPGHTPTPGPSQTTQPTAAPGTTPTPDPHMAALWVKTGVKYSCDMDFDGKLEELELSLAGSYLTVRIKVGRTGKELTERLSANLLKLGFVYNFNADDMRAELVLSVVKGSAENVVCYRLNSASDDLLICDAVGRVEDLKGEIVVIGRYIDLMGTWDCTAGFCFARSGFYLDMVDELWIVKPEERFCTLADDMIAGLYTSGQNNESVYLTEGDVMRPVSTNMTSKINIELESGAQGYLTVAVSNGRFLYGGRPIEDYFSDLTFIEHN